MILALGTAQFGMQYGLQKSSRPQRADAIGIIDAAVGTGVCMVDTAACYGDAEEIIGEYLESHKAVRKALQIITKVRPDIFEGIDTSGYYDMLENHAAKSMARLKTDYLDGLLLHKAHSAFDPQAMEALIRIKRIGTVRRVGVSVYLPEEALEALRWGIDIIQVPYNIFDRRLDETGFFIKAKEQGIMTVARSVLLQGLLMMRHVPEYMQFASVYVDEFHAICRELRLSPLECAVGFVASHPLIDCLLFGVDNKRQLLEMAEAAGLRMDAEKHNELSRRFSNVPVIVISPQDWPRKGE